MSKPRALVIGYGSMGRRRAAYALERDWHVDVVDEDPIQTAGVDTVVRWEDLAAGHDPYDAAFVATPPETHVGIARKLVAWGTRAVLIEKPLATNLDLTETLVDEAERAGTRIVMGQTLRFHRDVRKMEEIISDGGLGVPIYGSAWFGHRLDIWEHPDPVGTYTNGALVDAGTHEIDLLLWLMGEDAESVVGTTVRTGMFEMEREDVADAVFSLRSGATAHVHADLVSTVYRRGLSIAGTDNSANWDWRPDDEMYDRETRAFLHVATECAEDHRLATVEEGRRTLTLALAARMSRGRTLSI